MQNVFTKFTKHFWPFSSSSVLSKRSVSAAPLAALAALVAAATRDGGSETTGGRGGGDSRCLMDYLVKRICAANVSAGALFFSLPQTSGLCVFFQEH